MTNQDEFNILVNKSLDNLGEQTKLLQEQISSLRECLTILQDGCRNGDMLLADAIERQSETVKTILNILNFRGEDYAKEVGLKGLIDEALGRTDEKDI